jgi:hypothetical protein
MGLEVLVNIRMDHAATRREVCSLRCVQQSVLACRWSLKNLQIEVRKCCMYVHTLLRLIQRRARIMNIDCCENPKICIRS